MSFIFKNQPRLCRTQFLHKCSLFIIILTYTFGNRGPHIFDQPETILVISQMLSHLSRILYDVLLSGWLVGIFTRVAINHFHSISDSHHFPPLDDPHNLAFVCIPAIHQHPSHILPREPVAPSYTPGGKVAENLKFLFLATFQ